VKTLEAIGLDVEENIPDKNVYLRIVQLLEQIEENTRPKV